MSTSPSMFRTHAAQVRHFAAYEATLALWPVPVESFDVPTRFGQTHTQACGPKEAPPLVLRPGAGHALNFDQPERVNHRILDF